MILFIIRYLIYYNNITIRFINIKYIIFLIPISYILLIYKFLYKTYILVVIFLTLLNRSVYFPFWILEYTGNTRVSEGMKQLRHPLFVLFLTRASEYHPNLAGIERWYPVIFLSKFLVVRGFAGNCVAECLNIRDYFLKRKNFLFKKKEKEQWKQSK